MIASLPAASRVLLRDCIFLVLWLVVVEEQLELSIVILKHEKHNRDQLAAQGVVSGVTLTDGFSCVR